MRLWPRKYVVVIVGMQSGNVTQLPFVTFRREDKAREWVMQMNERSPSELALFDYRDAKEKR